MSFHLTTQEGAGVSLSVATPSYSDKVGRRPVNLAHRDPCSPKCILRATLAAFASLAATVFLLFACRGFKASVFKASVLKSGIWRRRLSDNGDSSGSELPGLCRERAVEWNSFFSLTPDRDQFQEDVLAPIAKKPYLATDETEIPGFSPVTRSFSHSDAHARAASPTTRGEQPVEAVQSGLPPDQARRPMTSLTRQRSHALTDDLGGVSPETPLETSGELVASSVAILLRSEALQDASPEHAVTSDTQNSTQEQTSFGGTDYSLFLPGSHSPAVLSPGFTIPQDQIEQHFLHPVFWRPGGTQPDGEQSPLVSPSVLGPVQAAESRAVKRRTVQWRVQSRTAFEGPSQSAEGQQSSGQGDAGLPTLPDGRIYSHLIDPHRTVTKWMNCERKIIGLVYRYKQLARLLRQERLTHFDVELVAERVDRLLAGLIVHRFPDLSHAPCQNVVTLAIRFLALNTLVSGLQLLGIPREGMWWEVLTERLPHDYGHVEAQAGDEAQEFTIELMCKLRDAIGTLKTGECLASEALSEVNSLLFCHKYSPPRIVRSQWNISKEDDDEDR